jgi:1,2-diacylglycerol-3-alpha-glucose alpha-1,2-galactosyltransferase
MATEGIVTVNKQIRAAGAHVRFLGLLPLEDMPAIYNAADLFLFPSYQENCPLAPLEAAASGLPVIYRDIPEYLDLYEHPYLRASNTDEFIALTKRMSTDRAFLDKGRSMSRNLLTQFDNERIRKQLLALYEEIMESQVGG